MAANALTTDHLWLVQTVYERFAASAEWPAVDDLQYAVDRAGDERDVYLLAESLDRRFGWLSTGQERVELTLCGVARCEAATADLDDVLAVGSIALTRYLDLGPGVELIAAEVAAELDLDSLRLAKVLALTRWLPGFGGGSGNPDSWTRQITREIRRWRLVKTTAQMVDLATCASDESGARSGLGIYARTANPFQLDVEPAAKPPADTSRSAARGSFSIREAGEPLPTNEVLSPAAWGGVVATVRSLVADNSFASAYPTTCYDNPAMTVGTDVETLSLAVADHSELQWPLDPTDRPDADIVMDLLEFLFTVSSTASNRPGGWHQGMKHYHLQFDQTAGRRAFGSAVNGLMRRHGLAFAMNQDGVIERLGSPIDRARASTLPSSGDSVLDQRLSRAMEQYRSPHFDERVAATRELWASLERLKTLANPADKKSGSTELIRNLSQEFDELFHMIEADMKALTTAGNRFSIRHSEMDQAQIENVTQLDYLFGRLFNLIWALLRSKQG